MGRDTTPRVVTAGIPPVRPVPGLTVVPLSEATLDETVALCRLVFPWNGEAATAPCAALAPHRHPSDLLDHGCFDRVCWVALLEGAVAGMIDLHRQLDDFRDALHIGWLAVAPARRRRGIGAALLRLAVAEANASGVAALRLVTSDSGDEILSQPLYEAFGFGIVRTRPESWGRANWTTIWREKPLRSHPVGASAT